MIIANPIYDVVFKRMMENERVAKFFIGTLLDQQLVSIEVKPQEFTYKDNDGVGFAVFRLDFIATIKTELGEHIKILIEIQKARNLIDLMRFRRYLGEQYTKEDIINGEKVVLPITTIYILGFNLPGIESACIKVNRHYIDLINKTVIESKNEFVEKLTHDCFIVQVNRITDRFQTRLDKLLSLFEQRNFMNDEKTVKDYRYAIDNEDLKVTTDILHHTGTDPEERKKIEIEQEAWRSINAMFEPKEKEYWKKLEENRIALEEKNKEIENKDKVIEDKDKIIEDLKRRLGDK